MRSLPKALSKRSHCRWLYAPLCSLTLVNGNAEAAKEDIEFASEHIGEVGLENRLAQLPIWAMPNETERWSTVAQLGYLSAGSDSLTVDGPMAAFAIHRKLSDRWSLGAFASFDRFDLRGGTEQRPLQTLFAPKVPIARPVETQFSGLEGRNVSSGVGLVATLRSDRGWLGEHRWVAGLSWQRVDLDRFDYHYRVLEGAQAGISGSLDFSASYDNLAGLVGLELLRDIGNWTLAPHLQFTVPVARRGFAGRITGPGFEFAGDSASAGNGAHFGDTTFSLGLQILYRPAHLSIDVGSTLTQAVLVPLNKRGIDKNIAFCVQWSH